MHQFGNFLDTLDGFLGSAAWFAYFLLGVGLFFTIYLKFPQIRYFKYALRIVKGKYDKADDKGDTSHFQALTTALSGTVGTGNIAGVALAIHQGGPAALFWMLVTAMLGMTTKFVEVTLSHKYREMDSKGQVAGGPMYYMKNKLNMKWLAVIFAIATVISSFGTGNMPQINSISSSLNATFGVQQWIVGAVLAVLLGMVIIGGISRIAKVTEKLVPAMAIIYFVGAFAVIISNYHNILPSFGAIFGQIFTGSAAIGGFLGASFAFLFNRGVNRGLFSNEAGQGSAPIAHAAARAHEPVSEGMVALLEPFIDTIIICSLTGLVLLSSGVWNKKYDNKFEMSDLQILSSSYTDQNEQGVLQLRKHILGSETLAPFNGELEVVDGKIQNDLSIIHARSLAENVIISKGDVPYNGKVAVSQGKPDLAKEGIVMNGKSLLHSAPLTTEAFKQSFMGENGKFIVSIGLLLFAFSTVISWSYYGDRAITYLVGAKGVPYYRVVYILAFFLASFTDTTIIWKVSYIAIVLMTLPNLFGILLLRKDMKSTVKEYWIDFKQNWPGAETPE
ncbi:MAG: sodium:alanine symporter family protein [Bacteroidetes bacterium HGW-Bacteroidetes-17]|nr:MAG: sodium:alanine symporter family protein [Bacteroidetes bacterium HGW-Bacteroidetes-17]